MVLNMAEELKECSQCFSNTKYACIKCKKPVCNVCGVAELDEDADGWIYGKQVSYRYSCKRKSNLFTKRKSIISGAVPSDEQRKGTKTCITDAGAKAVDSYACDTSLSTSSTCRYRLTVNFIHVCTFE